MTNCEFFSRLLHALQNFDEALLLATLVAQGSTEQAVRSSVRRLADTHLGGALNPDQVYRASSRLAERGLLQLRVYPKTYTEYTVPVDALRALLAQPLPDARYLPGVSQLPIPFLARLQAEAVLDAAAATAPPSISPSEDDQ